MVIDCDLERFYGEQTLLLPATVSHEFDGMAFGSSNLPVPPPVLVSNTLCATWAYHFYGDFPIEQVSLEAGKDTYRQLALLLLACVFHKPEKVKLELQHPRSIIRRLLVRPRQHDENYPGLVSMPYRFTYFPELPARHPWSQMRLSPGEMPVLTLTNQQEMLSSHEDLPNRDTVVGYGSDQATCLFAELLLNAGLADNQQLEFRLEGECGYRGVGPGSAEIALWLPGSLGYLDAEPI